MSKYLIVTDSNEDRQRVKEMDVTVREEYPDAVLAECSAARAEEIRSAGLEVAELAAAPSLATAGVSFTLEAALAADDIAPLAPPPGRLAYFIVRMVGPIKGEWLEALRELGGVPQGSLPGFCQIVGLLPERLEQLQQNSWVEAVTPYRPAMKVASDLRRGTRRNLAAEELAAAPFNEPAPWPQRVEVSVFEGEDLEALAARLRDDGGTILDQSRTSMTAVVPQHLLNRLAEEPAVRSILPDAPMELHNDRAAEAMGMNQSREFTGTTLQGHGQIVAVADSGLDTGDPSTVHADFRGRVEGLVSLPNRMPHLANDPPPFDDGAADTHSGHGTHVSGSVLGDGSAAAAAGHDDTAGKGIPRGAAPGARLFFQAIEQRVAWKSTQQLVQEGQTLPPGWPFNSVGLWGIPHDLGDLFQPAYDAGARIHTNSWGSPIAGIYTDRSATVDRFMSEHRDFLVLYSAGNSGKDGDFDGAIDRDSIGSPGTAKNCLTVGASENDRPNGSSPAPGVDAAWSALRWPTLTRAGHVSDNVEGMAAFSSRGPTDDDRIKPDVVAPGTNVLSTRSSTFVPTLSRPEPGWGDVGSTDPLRGLYHWNGGTSMSTPLVAGAAALVRQHLVEQRGHFEEGSKPSGALLKAFLIHSARRLAGQFPGEVPPGPNSVSGFGRVDVGAAANASLSGHLHFVDDPDAAVESLSTERFSTEVTSTQRPLKVTLVWTDPPSHTGFGGGGLVNKLYLRVRLPDNTTVNGDVAPIASPINNVQQVLIEAPPEGVYSIHVHGIEVSRQSPGATAGANPRQDFVLVVSGVEELTEL